MGSTDWMGLVKAVAPTLAAFQAAPLLISKLNTLLQLILVSAVIIHYGLLPLPATLIDALIGLTALTTVWSGAAYAWCWGQRAWRQIHPPVPSRDTDER